jgi:hypothetical protein
MKTAEDVPFNMGTSVDSQVVNEIYLKVNKTEVYWLYDILLLIQYDTPHWMSVGRIQCLVM